MPKELQCLERVRNFEEILWILFLIKYFSKGSFEISFNRLKKIHSEKCIRGSFLSFEDSLEIMKLLQLCTTNGENIILTSLGIKIINQQKNGSSDPNEGQLHDLIYSIFFSHGPLENEVNRFIRSFSMNEGTGIYENIGSLKPEWSCDLNFVFLASSLNLIKSEITGKLFLNPKYQNIVQRKIGILKNSEWWDREPTTEEIDASKEAERLVEKNEKQRLITLGREDLAKSVKVVSYYDAKIGYDVLSYEDNYSKLDEPDRFIEVKESVKSKVVFNFSYNEQKTARKYREKYHIHFLGNFKIGNSYEDCLIRIIDDPAKNLLDFSKYRIDAKRLIISEL